MLCAGFLINVIYEYREREFECRCEKWRFRLILLKILFWFFLFFSSNPLETQSLRNFVYLEREDRGKNAAISTKQRAPLSPPSIMANEHPSRKKKPSLSSLRFPFIDTCPTIFHPPIISFNCAINRFEAKKQRRELIRCGLYARHER